MNLLIRTLEEKELLPALFFVLSRKGCEKYAQKVEGTLITSSETSAVRHIWNFHLHRNKEKLEKLPQYHTLYELVQRGIAFHHSGIVPTLKEIIEILFGKGLIKTLFATETFAVGINMPTKTAVFVDLEKFDEEFNGMRLLKTAEYLQMAGRAGRRGLDTMGTVIYFPDRAPVDPSEMQAMMRGGKAPVTSRMDFGYDFILKTIQSGNRNWLDILEKSYWRRQREEWISDIKKSMGRKNGRLQQITFTSEEAAAMAEKDSLLLQISQNTNAKRKKAELALKAWNEFHSGSRWLQVGTQYAEVLEIKRQLKLDETDLEKALDVSSSVESKIKVLQACGFLNNCDDLKSISADSLTSRGVLASELNECDSLLVSQFYLMSESKLLEPKDLLCILAACIFEGAKKDGEPRVDDIDVSHTVKAGIKDLIELWNCVRDEEDKIRSKPYEFQLSTFWVTPMNRWMSGEPIAQICADIGIYEGNMIRSVLKLNNMLEEWRSMAMYCEDAEILEKFRDAHTLIIRESVIQDSIYLNL
jgi:superfamily II RNA helicase